MLAVVPLLHANELSRLNSGRDHAGLVSVVGVRLVGAPHHPLELGFRKAELLGHVRKILLRERRVIGRLGELFERLLARHLAGEDQTGEMRPSLVVPKLLDEPIPLVEPREHALKVLVRIGLPPKPLAQRVDRPLLRVGDQVQWAIRLHALEVAIVDVVLEHPAHGKSRQRSRPVSAMDILDHADIVLVDPFVGFPNAFRGMVGTGKGVLEAMLDGIVVERREHNVILNDILVRYLRFEEGNLQIAHFVPVHHLDMKLASDALGDLADVVVGDLQIPSRIAAEQERPQAEDLFSVVGEIRAVHPAREADDTVVIPVLAIGLEPGDDTLEFTLRLRRAGIPVRLDALVEVAAMVAHAFLIEHDLRVARVHHAVRANLVLSLTGFVTHL